MMSETRAKEAYDAVTATMPGLVAAAALSSANGGAKATKLILASSGCYVTDDQRFPTAFHPTAITVSGSAVLGMVLGNYGLVLGFCALCYAVLCVVRFMGPRLLPSAFDGLDIQGFLRLPAAPLLLFTFVFEGTCLGCVMLMLTAPSTGSLVIGIFAFAGCMLVPVAVFGKIRANVPQKAAYVVDHVYTGRVWAFLIGPGEWVSVSKANHWVDRWASVMRTFREDVVWYIFVDYASMLALAAMAAVKTEDYVSCGHVKFFSSFVFLIELVSESYTRPHCRGRDNATDFVILVLQTVGLLCTGIGFYLEQPKHAVHTAAMWCFYATWACLTLKIAADLVTEIYVLATRRRSRLQDQAFTAQRKEQGWLVAGCASDDNCCANDSLAKLSGAAEYESFGTSEVSQRSSPKVSPKSSPRTSPKTRAAAPRGRPHEMLARSRPPWDAAGDPDHNCNPEPAPTPQQQQLLMSSLEVLRPPAGGDSRGGSPRAGGGGLQQQHLRPNSPRGASAVFPGGGEAAAGPRSSSGCPSLLVDRRLSSFSGGAGLCPQQPLLLSPTSEDTAFDDTFASRRRFLPSIDSLCSRQTTVDSFLGLHVGTPTHAAQGQVVNMPLTPSALRTRRSLVLSPPSNALTSPRHASLHSPKRRMFLAT
ncbi:hypothetical protein DIPPA_33506 [Diplonema papillatum]|nr:hypothetical protein DIPPA_33506 [Diplonema papillatum]